MNKSDLINALKEDASLSRKDAEKVVDKFFGDITDTMANGDRVEIRGFGTFRARHYPAYAARNPRTGEAVEARPKVLPVFRAGKDLLRRVNAEED